MLKPLQFVENIFTKLKLITKYFDKSTYSATHKINIISYILQVYNVGIEYSSYKGEITHVF